MPLITRVELKNGTVYELGKVWPVKDKAEGGKGIYKVGLIRLCPEESNYRMPEDEEDEGEEGSDTFPAHYEFWCVPDSFWSSFFNPIAAALVKGDEDELVALVENLPLLAQGLDQHKILRCRNIYLSQIAYEDTVWETKEALNEIHATVVGPTFPPEPALPNAAQPQPEIQVAPTNGESAEPVA